MSTSEGLPAFRFDLPLISLAWQNSPYASSEEADLLDLPISTGTKSNIIAGK